jgi:hypothetical protein
MLNKEVIKMDGNTKEEKVCFTYYIIEYGNLQLMLPGYLMDGGKFELPHYDVTFYAVDSNGVRKLIFCLETGWKTYLILVDKDASLSIDLDKWGVIDVDNEDLPSFNPRYIKVERVEVEDKKGFFLSVRLDKIEVEESNKKHTKKYVLG